MNKIVNDQADGLRRLLARTPMRILAVTGMLRAMGVTSVAMNLAAALAQQGRQVLLLDENHNTEHSVCAQWGVAARGTLADVMARRMACDDAAARAPCGVSVLPAAQPLDAFDPQLLQPHQVVLVDARLDAGGNLSRLARAAGEIVLVLRSDPNAITATYAGIKHLHYAHALKQLRFVLNGITREDDAQRIGHNMAQAGSRYLGVSLELAGWVHLDARLDGARRQQLPVVDAYPASPSAEDMRRIASDMDQWPWRPAAAQRPSQADPARRPPPAGPTERRVAMA